MTDIKATLIIPSSKAEEARAIAGGFDVGLSASGDAPATHYVASGWMPAEQVEQVEPLCSTVDHGGDGLSAIASAGLYVSMASTAHIQTAINL